MTLIDKVIDAHGGAARWQAAGSIEAEISVSGFLFAAKHLPVLNHVHVRAQTREPRFSFMDFPKPGMTGEFFGDEKVALTGSSVKADLIRTHPRAAFSSIRRFFYWDMLDFLYFGGYATWNYLLTPFLFLRNGFQFSEMEPVTGDFGAWSRLRVTFPDDMATHCRTQTFYFDESFLLRRLDYTAEVVGGWAHAAHFCDEYRDFSGIKVPTRRRVFPMLFGGRPRRWLTLVAIDIHDLRLLQDNGLS